MNTPLIELRKKPHTSISAVREYLSCPRRYFLRYVLKLQPAFRAAALSFGSAWHATLGEWLLAPVAEEELRAHLRDGLLARLREDGANVLFDDEDENEGSLVDTAERMLGVFLAKVPRPEKTLAVEAAFSIDVAHPATGEVLPVPLIGAIDAVVLEGGQGAVWELKTAKRKWSADQFAEDLQMTTYGMAARHLGYDGAELKVLVTTKGARSDVQRETVVRHRGDERELLEVILGVHRAIEAGADHPVRSWACKVCPFAGACRS